MFGGLEFSDKLAGAGIQPIVGVSLACQLTEKKTKPGQLPGPPCVSMRGEMD